MEIFAGLVFVAEVSAAAFAFPEVLVAVSQVEHATVAVENCQRHLEMQDFCQVELLQEETMEGPFKKNTLS